MQELLIHIGYQKTGTTWLQHELFTSSNSTFEPFSLKSKDRSSIFLDFIQGKDGYLLSSFVYNEEVIKREILKILKQKHEMSDKKFVLSAERLCGNPFSSGFDAKVIADRLYHFFPNAKIFIVIREQKSYLVSTYFQYLSGHGVLGITNFFTSRYNGIPYFSPNHANYLPLINYYHTLYSKDRVLVLPYELFKEDSEEFINRLGDFIGCKIDYIQSQQKIFRNKTKDHFVLYYFRYLNYFTSSRSQNNYSGLYYKNTKFIAIWIQKFLFKITPKSLNQYVLISTKKFVHNFVGNRYENANRQLSKLIGFDLSKYGYHQ